MAIDSEIASVKAQAGGRGARSGMTDAAYQEVIDRVEDWIEVVTKHEWVSTDKDIAAIRGIAETFAAVDVRRRFNEDDKEADRMEKSANERLKQFVATSDYATRSRSFVNIAMAFHSYPMNPAARPYTGLKRPYTTSQWNSYLYPWRI